MKLWLSILWIFTVWSITFMLSWIIKHSYKNNEIETKRLYNIKEYTSEVIGFPVQTHFVKNTPSKYHEIKHKNLSLTFPNLWAEHDKNKVSLTFYN
jgi:hypothetical protein